MTQESEKFDQMLGFRLQEQGQRIVMLESELLALKYGFAHLDYMFKSTIAFLQKNQSKTCYEQMIKEVPDLKIFLPKEI